MRSLLAVSALSLALACKPATAPTPPAADVNFSLSSPDAKAAADSINAFGADLHGAIASQDGNLFYSPASISIALAMTEGGARGPTKDEMDKALHLPPNVQATYAGLLAKLGTSKSPELSIANRLFGDKALHLDPAFVKSTNDYYGAPVESVDFRHDAEGARVRINDWVASTTKDRIRDLVAPMVLNKDSRLVLTNAIYFKGKWARAFEKRSTYDAVFHAKSDESVPTMHETLDAKLGEHDNAQVLDLDYKGEGQGLKLAMTIVLPKDVHGVGEVEKAYTSEGIAPFVASEAMTSDVDVALPKFRATLSMELAETLSRMGMKLAFDDHADFSGISPSDPLKISNVIHKAFVDVDEQGTEAAAATAVVMATATAAPTPGPTFIADHPFLFFIRDTESGAVLFAGRLADPKR